MKSFSANCCKFTLLYQWFRSLKMGLRWSQICGGLLDESPRLLTSDISIVVESYWMKWHATEFFGFFLFVCFFLFFSRCPICPHHWLLFSILWLLHGFLWHFLLYCLVTLLPLIGDNYESSTHSFPPSSSSYPYYILTFPNF